MNLYNAEFFDQDFNFRCASQFGEFKYKFDYLDWEKSSITIKPIKVEMGDIVLISGDGKKITGRVTETKEKKKELIVKFKPFTERLDVDIFTTMEFDYVEDYIKDLIEEEYVYSGDELQNINGLVVNALTHTEGQLDFETGINNLYEITLKAFDAYQIVVDFHFEPADMILYCDIFRNEAEIINIEADLGNVTEKEINVLEYKEKTNKVTIYDEDNYGRHITYYMTKSGEVTPNPADDERITPVRDKSVAVGVKYYKEKAKEVSGIDFTISDAIDAPMQVTDWSVNLLDLNVSSKTTNGITFTVSGGVITATGTATSDAKLEGSISMVWEGDYALSCCPKSVIPRGYYSYVQGFERHDIGRGLGFYKKTEKPEEGDPSPETLRWGIVIEEGTTVDGVVFKPMLAKGSTVQSYVPPNGYTIYSTDDNGHTASVTITKDSEAPIDGLQSWKGFTRVYSDGFAKVKYQIDEEDDWNEKSLKKATSTLKGAEYKNNITITCGMDDPIIRPKELQVGQIVNVISNGIPYQTILTGWEYKNGIKLQFGTLRFELTKILKRRWREQ